MSVAVLYFDLFLLKNTHFLQISWTWLHPRTYSQTFIYFSLKLHRPKFFTATISFLFYFYFFVGRLKINDVWYKTFYEHFNFSDGLEARKKKKMFRIPNKQTASNKQTLFKMLKLLFSHPISDIYTRSCLVSSFIVSCVSPPGNFDIQVSVYKS